MEEQQRIIIKKGFELLVERFNYKQVAVVNKLKKLGHVISPASLSKMLNDKPAGSDALWIASNGIKDLIFKELGFEFLGNEYVNTTQADWSADIITVSPDPESSSSTDINFYELGRLEIGEKTNFFSTAVSEVIEFGLSLNSFSNYFYTRKEAEFKAPVEALLNKGVNFKCYLLDPDSNEARLYFEDRKKYVEEDARGIEKIKNSIERLQKMHNEFKATGFSGQFEVFKYKHIPQNYFLVVDGSKLGGKMMVSHYLYGELRANCPVMVFPKDGHRDLFRKYWNALDKLTQKAKKIQFD